MKKPTIFLLILNFCILLASFGFTNASNNPPEFEIVTIKDLSAEICDIDSNATAAYLFDRGKSSFYYDEYNGFQLHFERKARIKIYSNQGLDYADIQIPLYKKDLRNLELIKDIEAYTYNLENGSIVKTGIDKKEIFEEDYNENWIIKKFTLPKVKAGSIIDIYYKIESPFLFNLRDWDFQCEIPVKVSEYEVFMPPFYEYMINQKGSLDVSKSEPILDTVEKRFNGLDYKDMRFKWTAKNVAAFYEEEYMTSKENYISRVEFQLSKVNYPGRGSTSYLSTWEDLIRSLTKETSFGKFQKIKVDDNLIEKLVSGKTDDVEKARVIHKYVKENFRWNGKRSIYPADDVKEFEAKREGNCTAINIILLNMLEAAGIEAYPVLLSTRDNGEIDFNYPFIDEFNYTAVVLSADDNYIILDATRKYLPFGMLPYECRNGRGLLVKKKTAIALNLNENSALYRVETFANLYIDKDTKLMKAKIILKASHYAGVEYREIYTADEKRFIQKFIGTDNIENLKVKNLDKLDKPFIISYDVDLGGAASEMIYLAPILVGRIKENPFKLPVRTYPVDYNFRRLHEYRFSFVVPEGYDLVDFPETEEIKTPDDKVEYNYKSVYKENFKQLQLSNVFLISSPVIEPEGYQHLKSLYSDIITKQEQPIILKKL